VREISLRLGKVPREHLDAAGKIIVRNAKLTAAQRIRKRTGEYIRGFGYSVKRVNRDEAMLEVFNRAGHAAGLEHGTRAHTIKPSRASVLRFKVAGKTVFSKSVKHPGTRPYRILRDGVTRSLGEMFNDLLRRVKEIGK